MTRKQKLGIVLVIGAVLSIPLFGTFWPHELPYRYMPMFLIGIPLALGLWLSIFSDDK